MAEYIVTLDAGTGSGRCIIFDTEGNQLGVSQEEWYPKTIPEYPGSQVFDTTEAWQILINCIKEAMQKVSAKAEEIIGVTVTSMREGFVLYDKDGNEIWACPNADSRAHEEVKELVAKGLGEKIYRTGGDWFGMAAPPRFLWIKRHQPEIYEKIARMTMLSDWVLYRLTGEFVTDPSVGSSCDLFDLSRRTWSEETIETFDLPRGIYPPVYESGTIIGEVTEKAARETGLKKGTPVITSGADTQLALTGVGAVHPLDYVIVAGSFWQTAVVSDIPLIHPECKPRTLCHTVPGQWMTEGIGFLHGYAMRWFRDGFCAKEKEVAAEQGVDPYYVLEKMAEQVPPGSNGLIAIFSDIMNAKRWKQAAPCFMQIDIFSPSTCGKKEFFRALEENAAYVSYGNYQNLLELTNHIPEEIIFCAGSSKGFLWPQIMADVYGIRMKVPVVKESTALGAAMCVGVGLGRYKDLAEAVEDIVRWDKTFEPNMGNHKAYKKYYDKWHQVYPRILRLTDEGLLEPMWRAPGT